MISMDGADRRTGESARAAAEDCEEASCAGASRCASPGAGAGTGTGADEVRESAEPYSDKPAIGEIKSSNATWPSIRDPSIGATVERRENPEVAGFVAVEFMVVAATDGEKIKPVVWLVEVEKICAMHYAGLILWVG